MVTIPAGSFMMGSPDTDQDAWDHEKPQHLVNVKAFAIGKYPVTQGQYKAVMGSNPSRFQGNPNRPVECVSWYDATKFCEKLSQLTGKQYRLPSEAEWEYACRAGTSTCYYFGDDAGQLRNYAWFGDNSGNSLIDSEGLWDSEPDWKIYHEKILDNGCRTKSVGHKLPNQWGLHDMHGNVWEWCLDHWHDNYKGAPTDGSAWVMGEMPHDECGVGCPGFLGTVAVSLHRPSTLPTPGRYLGVRVVCERPSLS